MQTHFIQWPLLLALSFAPSTSQHADAPSARAELNPFSRYALEESGRRWVHGRVEERLPAGPYIYLRMRQASGEPVWLVSLALTTPATDRVQALVLGEAAHFHSPRLGRDFTPLLFAAVRRAAP